MKKICLVSLLSCVLLVSNAQPDSYTNAEIVTKINKIDPQTTSHSPNSYNEEELINLIKTTLSHLPYIRNTREGNERDTQVLLDMQNFLINKLRKYHVSGVSFAVDPNLALFIESQNPAFSVVYKDSEGNIKTRSYQAEINTVGFKAEASIKLDLIFFTGTGVNFYDSNKVITLGTGIDANLSVAFGIGITYAPFTNIPGGIVIVSLPILFAFPSLSVVTGGSLTPTH